MAKGDSFWEVFDSDLPFLGAKYGKNRARMAIVGLGNGGLLVVSPGALPSEEQWAELAKCGEPRFLLAPNHFHNGGIAVWQARFPHAQVVAHPLALKRLRKKVPGVAFHDMKVLVGELPEHMHLLAPPGAKQGELWLSLQVAAGRAWFVTDAIINETKLPRGLLGWLVWLLGFRAALMTNPFFKRLFLADKRAYQTWVIEQLEREAPVLFVPAHGKALQGAEVGERLRVATERA